MAGKTNMMREMREARSFAMEVKLVLVLKAKRRLRRARRTGDSAHARELQSLIDRTKAQGRVLRHLHDPIAIRACADEWQEAIGYLDLIDHDAREKCEKTSN